MGIIIRQGIKASIVGYLGILIGAFNVLWLFPQFLTQSEIGLLNLIESTALFFVPFAGWGVFSIVDKFFSHFQDKALRHQGYLFFLFLYLNIGLILFIFLFWLFYPIWKSYYATKSPQILDYTHLILIFTIILSYLALFEGYTRLHLRIVVPNFLREVLLKCLIIGSILLYALDIWTFEEVLWARVGFYGLIGFILILYVHHLGVLFLQINFQRIHLALLKEIGKFVVFVFPAAVGVLVIAQIDKLMIGAMLGLDNLGVYSIAFFIGAILEVPRKMLSQIATPLIAQAWARKDTDAIQKIYRQSALNQLIFGVFLFLCIWLNIDHLYQLIPNSAVYQAGKMVVFWVALTRLTDMATGMNTEILAYSPYYRFQLIAIVLLAILTIVFNYFLIPIRGIEGAAMALFWAYLLYNLLKFIFLWRIFGFQPFARQTVMVLLLGIVVYWGIAAIPTTANPWMALGVKSLLIFFFYGGLVWLLKLSPEINQLIQAMGNRIVK